MPATAVPDLIRAVQKRYGYSPRDISRRANGLISKSTIYGYLHGQVPELPRPDRLAALAEALHVQVAVLTRAFLSDLGLDLYATLPTPEEVIISDTTLGPEDKDLLLRQLERLRRAPTERHTE